MLTGYVHRLDKLKHKSQYMAHSLFSTCSVTPPASASPVRHRSQDWLFTRSASVQGLAAQQYNIGPGFDCSPVRHQSRIGCSPVRHRSQDPLHHRQVFPVVVSLEQRQAQVELEQDAADTPHITGLRPADL